MVIAMVKAITTVMDKFNGKDRNPKKHHNGNINCNRHGNNNSSSSKHWLW